MPITLEALTRDNFTAVTALSVAPNQVRYVAENLLSIAQSKVYDYAIPLVVCAAGTPVGFAMWGRSPATQRVFIFRLMIDHHHQHRGYGRAAVTALVELARLTYPATDLYLSLVPENVVARRLYESLGFSDTGEVDEDGEIVYRLPAPVADTTEPT
jgi:diamine N-acetyltransferase